MHIRVYPIFAHILGIAARFRPKMPEDAILKRGAPRPPAGQARDAGVLTRSRPVLRYALSISLHNHAFFCLECLDPGSGRKILSTRFLGLKHRDLRRRHVISPGFSGHYQDLGVAS